MHSIYFIVSSGALSAATAVCVVTFSTAVSVLVLQLALRYCSLHFYQQGIFLFNQVVGNIQHFSARFNTVLTVNN